jgi:hypothetical protein
MESRNNRKNEVIKNKLSFIAFLVVLVTIVVISDYDFNNNIINGFLLMTFSFYTTLVLFNDSFYIETGLKSSDESSLDKMEIYSQMHPFWAIFNKLLALSFYAVLIISLIFIAYGIYELRND